MTLRLHRVPLFALALVIAVVAVPAASATATQFPTAEQIAQHQGTGVAPSTQANVHFPTARQVALHEGILSGPSTVRTASNSGFSWGDAGMGAGAALVLVTALAYGALTFRNRRQRGLRGASTA